MSAEVLLAHARLVKEKQDARAAATGESFNLFAVLGRETDEVHTHSAILAELLDPRGSHRRGTAFLHLFLDRFGERFGIPEIPVEAARVRREATIDAESRADILIETGDARILIENKIGAADRCRQLERYHAYAHQRSKAKVFYLTLHGNDPRAGSLGDVPLAEVARISYATDVLAWLDDCVREAALVPQLREILVHYQGLVRKLTGQSTGELTMALKDLLANQIGDIYNFELAPAIAEAMTALSVDVEWAFWHNVKRQLLDGAGRPWRLELALMNGDDADPPKKVTKDVVRHAHGTGHNRWLYGWTFRIASDTDPDRYRADAREVLLRVECDGYGWCLYGLIAARRRADGTYRLAPPGDRSPLFARWAECASTLGERWCPRDGAWLAWTYPAEDVSLQKDDAWLDPKVIRTLVEHRGDHPLVDDIRATIDALHA